MQKQEKILENIIYVGNVTKASFHGDSLSLKYDNYHIVKAARE